jgi:hypothetical protein
MIASLYDDDLVYYILKLSMFQASARLVERVFAGDRVFVLIAHAF